MSFLKIALVADWFLPQIGGIELHTRDLALQMKALGHEVRIVTTFPGPSEVDGISVYRLKTLRLPGWEILLQGRPFREFKKILKNENFDVIHAHSGVVSPLAYGALFIAKRLKIPSVLTNHSLLQASAFVFRVLNALFQGAQGPMIFSSVSCAAAQGLSRATGRKEIPILPNGVDLQQWKVANLPSRPLRITSVMRLNKKKRPLDLIRSIPWILSQIPGEKRPRFTIVGDGPERPLVENEIQRLNLQHVVELTGFLPHSEIKKIFSETGIFVSPALKESFGIAVLEALSAGIPVVARDYGGVRELIQHGLNGLLAKSQKDWARAIVQLIQDENLRKRLAENSTQGLEKFGWDSVAQKHLDVYQRAIEECRKFHPPMEGNHEGLPHHRYGARLPPVSHELPGD